MTVEMRHVWSIEYEENYRGPNRFGIYSTTDTGLTYKMTVPEPLPTHIAAAYQVDMSLPDAADTIIDIIQHGFHIPEPLDPANWATDPAAQAGLKVKIVNHPEHPPGTEIPVTLYTAESDEDAVRAHMMRIAEVKTRIQYVPYTEVDPKTLRQSAAQMFHMTKDVEGKQPENPLKVFREKLLVTEEGLDEQMRAIKQARLWTHGKKPDPSLRTRSRLGPMVDQVRPKNDALVRKSAEDRKQPLLPITIGG